MNENINSAVAVCAADMQCSTNAIVKLAGDTGSIYSILSAADFSTILYVEIKKISAEIKAIANDAELLSRDAMDISIMAAESANISKQAKALLGNIKSINERLMVVVDHINNFEGLALRKKELNPLISDELIAMVNTAVLDGENAKSLIAVALRATKALVAACKNN